MLSHDPDEAKLPSIRWYNRVVGTWHVLKGTMLTVVVLLVTSGCGLTPVSISVETTQLLPKELALSYLQDNQSVRIPSIEFIHQSVKPCQINEDGVSGFRSSGWQEYRGLTVCAVHYPGVSYQSIFLSPTTCSGLDGCWVYYGGPLSLKKESKIVTALVSLGVKQGM